MGEPARTAVEMKTFKGMMTAYDSSDLEAGVSELQVNVNGLRAGQLEVRRGLREVTFESELE